uniref:Exocyst complex component 3 like 2 n=1 Tax=Monodelphis domestica TaxID=13616 RepID=A0A5F8GCV5_MONDO
RALVGELHRRALVEYVRPLLRGRLRCRSARSRSRVAGRLRDEAAQLQRLFRRLCNIWPRCCIWRTRRASRWKLGSWCGTTRTSGGSTWPPSWMSGDFGARRPATRSWPWRGTWSRARKGPPPRPGTEPFSPTFPSLGPLSAWASPSHLPDCPSTDWPGPIWRACPDRGPDPRRGPGPSPEGPGRLEPALRCCQSALGQGDLCGPFRPDTSGIGGSLLGPQRPSAETGI